MEALLVLSPPLAGLTETKGWVQRLTPWRVMKGHAENTIGQVFSRYLETALSSCLKVMSAFKTVCSTCPRASQTDTLTTVTGHSPLLLTCTSLSLVCTNHELLTPWFQLAPGVLDLVLFLASLSFMIQFFQSNYSLSALWCFPFWNALNRRIFSCARPTTSGFGKMLLVASNRNPKLM